MSNALSSEQRLWVVESNGTPRSGKGTITAGLTELFSGAAQDETGADYRAVTLGLILDGHLDPEMDISSIEKVVHSLGKESIADYAAQRHEIVAEQGNDALYTLEISETVGNVAPFDIVRSAVKEGFTRRVQRQVDNPDTRLLFVDGRNLQPVIQKVVGADILLRLFVDCQPFIAAKREALRQGVDIAAPDNDNWYRATLKSIRDRQLSDERRVIDPVAPDLDSINYWFNMEITQETAEHLARSLDISLGAAANMLAGEEINKYRQGGRHGAGAKALAEDRQVYFDTTEIGKNAMIQHAQRMVEEALDQNVGRYNPFNSGLVA